MPSGKSTQSSPRKKRSSTSEVKRGRPAKPRSVSPSPRRKHSKKHAQSSNPEEDELPTSAVQSTGPRRSPRKTVAVVVPDVKEVKRARRAKQDRSSPIYRDSEANMDLDPCEASSESEEDVQQRLRSMSPEVPWPSDQPSRPEEKSEGDEGEDNETPPPVTPSKNKGKQRADRYSAPTPSSSRNKAKPSNYSPVTYVDHKFKHPGTLHPSSWDNILEISSDEQPATPYDNDSPPVTPVKPLKKNLKRIEDSSEDDDDAQDDVPETPLKGITGKMDKSGLSSPRKASGSTRRQPPPTIDTMEDMISSFNIDNIGAHICPSLAGTYKDLPLLERAATQVICLGHELAVNRLREFLHRVHIRDNTPQERAIVNVVTAPSMGKLIHNPVRADWRKFTMHSADWSNASRSGTRHYFTHVDNPKEKVCFSFIGGATQCNTVDPKLLGSSGSLVKAVPFSPACLEWPRAFNFFAHLMGFDVMHITGWNGSVDFNTQAMKSEDVSPAEAANPFAKTAPPTTRTSQGVNPVDYRFVSGDKTEQLNNRLRAIINRGGLRCADEVPVFDMRQWFAPDGTPSDIDDVDMFYARLAEAPLYQKEIPQCSLVLLLALPFIYNNHYSQGFGTHKDLRFTLVSVCLLGTPFGQ